MATQAHCRRAGITDTELLADRQAARLAKHAIGTGVRAAWSRFFLPAPQFVLTHHLAIGLVAAMAGRSGTASHAHVRSARSGAGLRLDPIGRSKIRNEESADGKGKTGRSRNCGTDSTQALNGPKP
jgi:hypothetical protein